MPKNLEDRFTRFLLSLPGAELIDSLPLAQQTTGVRRADFLLGQRHVIVELKTLTVDTAHKAEAEMERHSTREEYPVFYGERDLHKVLAALPDAEKIHRRIYDAIHDRSKMQFALPKIK